jgi:hypothetical protein
VALVSPSLHAASIATNEYALDLFQGPVLAPIRVIGLGGAYAGYAEGIEGLVANAASPALRAPWSVRAFDYDFAVSLSLPITLIDAQNDDFDNSGGEDFDYSSFIFLSAGVTFQLDRLGVGATAELQQYSLSDFASADITVGKYHVLGAAGLVGDELMVGAGARLASLGIAAPDANFTFLGAAPELGLLYRPHWESYRIGATFRAPVYAEATFGGGVEEAGVLSLGGLVLPQHAVLPWEIEVGVAVQVGPRPLNPEWLDPRAEEAELLEVFRASREERARGYARELAALRPPASREALVETQRVTEAAVQDQEQERFRGTTERLATERRARFANWPREHLLFTAELLVTGAVQDGVSVERFLGQSHPQDPRKIGVLGPRSAGSDVGSSGADVSFSPRFGVETEPVLSRVHTRFGSYYEPSRFGRLGRQHFTFGADLRLFETTYFGLVPRVVYKLQGSVDLAPRYESYSIGLGVWR